MTDATPALLRLGTRGSRLALTQTNQIAALLRERVPGLRVETVVIHTTGDKILDSSLAQIGGKGVFTKEIEQALLDGRIDLAVHSLKDLPIDQPAGLTLGAVPERVPPHDILLAREAVDWKSLGPKDCVGTSSLRRRAQLRARNPRVEIRELRGNVPTRIQKMLDGAYTAIILAAAGVGRLGLSAPFVLEIPFDDMLPAPGQGAIGLQRREDDDSTAAVLAQVHHESSALCALAERTVLRRLGGGCQLPLGTLARIGEGGRMTLRARVASLDGARVVEDASDGPAAQAEALGEALAEKLLASGVSDILRDLEDMSEGGYEEAVRRAQSLNARPLGGLTALVTRNEDADGPLSVALREQGANPLCMPLVEHRPPEDTGPLHEAAARADEFDWIVFTSARGVDAFAEALESQGKSLGGVAASIACVGEGTARRVEERGGHVALVPGDASANGLVAAMSMGGFEDMKTNLGRDAQDTGNARVASGEAESLAGRSVLFPRADRARPTLAEELRRAGANVDDVVAYRTVATAAASSVVHELREGRVDAVLFTSASAAETLGETLEPQDLAILERLPVGAMGPATAAALRAHGVNVSFQPDDRSFAGLVAALVKHMRPS